jgi:hypothetical protein
MWNPFHQQDPPPLPERPAPTKADIRRILLHLPFPHGHVALASLVVLSQDEMRFAIEAAQWLRNHEEITRSLTQEISAESYRARKSQKKEILVMGKSVSE